jgi:hypothetical protein
MQLPRARSAAVSTRPAARFHPASGCHRREPTRPEPRSFSVTKVGAPERAPDLNCSFHGRGIRDRAGIRRDCRQDVTIYLLDGA